MSQRASSQPKGRSFPFQKNFFGNRAKSQSKGFGSKATQAKALNPLNQFYSERFAKLKKDADAKGLQNQSFCYKRVILALSKYPMPILCVEQAQFLEGVGDTVAQRF